MSCEIQRIRTQKLTEPPRGPGSMPRNNKQVVGDLVEEAKKRILFLIICVVGLSYMMSLTSSSVLLNFPAAAALIFIARHFLLDYEMRRKKVHPRRTSENTQSHKIPQLSPTISRTPDWREKIESPVVEDAIELLVRHIVSEWVTDLWYSRLTPDKEGPEELVQLMNNVFGEICYRSKSINVINLLTRDLVNLVCTHLKLFHEIQAETGNSHLESLEADQRDVQIKLALAKHGKLHPALVSTEAEHKVLQQLVDAFISLTLKPGDLHCSFFRCTARELLACAVLRPILNLFTPRFVNERIELFVISKTKSTEGDEACHSKLRVASNISSNNQCSRSINGVELVELKADQCKASVNAQSSKDPLLSVNTRVRHSWTTSAPCDSQPETTKCMGRKEERPFEKDTGSRLTAPAVSASENKRSSDDENRGSDILDAESSGDSLNEHEVITGLDSPGNRVWGGRKWRNGSVVHHIRHPLQNSENPRRRSKTGGHLVQQPVAENDSSGSSDDDDDDDGRGRRIRSGVSASPSNPNSTPEKNAFISDSFLQLRCEVLGANIVRSGSRMFAVYTVSVMDVDNKTWMIKRRFRHFERLHRRLKAFVFPHYRNRLPPKHFLSAGLDAPIVLERCKLLDRYLKNLTQFSTGSYSIEVWDFLSIDSQMYTFTNSLSIVETVTSPPKAAVRAVDPPPPKKPASPPPPPPPQPRESRKGLPSPPGSPVVEWLHPNLSAPVLDLVDAVFQVKDGGWIRRQVFWVAKQVLQLGMGDAVDDWLIEKIHTLRNASVVASAIARVERMMWPDGVFITKHQRQKGSEEDERRRERFVYDLMIDKAPPAIVGLTGRKEYQRCARDVYVFLQSSVCLRQLGYGLLELLLLTIFPELLPAFQNIKSPHFIHPT